MKKTFGKSTLSILVASAIASTAFCVPTYAETTVDGKSQAYQKALSNIPSFLANASEYPEGYGFTVDADATITVGSAIPAYSIDEEGVTNLDEVTYYPIYADNEVVAICTIVYDGEQYSYTLGHSFAETLNQFRANNEAIALVNDDNGFYMLSDNDELELLVEYEANEEFVTAQNVSQFDLYVDMYADELEFATCCASESDTIIPMVSTTSTSSSCVLPVQNVSQDGHGMCWAACVASIGHYHTGISKTAYQVCDYMGIGYDDGAGATQIKQALYGIYGVYYSIYNRVLTYNVLVNSIDADAPISGGMNTSSSGTGSGHVVVVNGYSGTSASNCNIIYYDPNNANLGYYTQTNFTSSSGGFTVLVGGKAYRNVDYLC